MFAVFINENTEDPYQIDLIGARQCFLSGVEWGTREPGQGTRESRKRGRVNREISGGTREPGEIEGGGRVIRVFPSDIPHSD